MSYTFTEAEQQQIRNALAQCTGLTWIGSRYEAVGVPGTNAVPLYQTLSSLIAQKLSNPGAFDSATLADLTNAKLWLDGVTARWGQARWGQVLPFAPVCRDRISNISPSPPIRPAQSDRTFKINRPRQHTRPDANAQCATNAMPRAR